MIKKNLLVAVLVCIIGDLFSQGGIAFYLERNSLDTNIEINDSTTMVAGENQRFSPGLGYSHRIKVNNIDASFGLSLMHFSETFVVENRVSRFPEIHEFFRIIVPLKITYLFKGFGVSAFLQPTFNFDSINPYEYEWMETAFNPWGLGLGLALEKQINWHFIIEGYYKYYPTPMYSNELYSFNEYGYGLTLSYLFKKKTTESNIEK